MHIPLHQLLGLPEATVNKRLADIGTTPEIVLADPNPLQLFNRLAYQHARAQAEEKKASIAELDDDTKEFPPAQ